MNSGTITFSQFLDSFKGRKSIGENASVVADAAANEANGGWMTDAGYAVSNLMAKGTHLGRAQDSAMGYLTGTNMDTMNKQREKDSVVAGAKSYRTTVADETKNDRAAIIQKTIDEKGATTTVDDIFNKMKSASPDILMGELAASGAGKKAIENRQLYKKQNNLSEDQMAEYDASMFDQWEEAIKIELQIKSEAAIITKKAEERQKELNKAMLEAAMATESWIKKIETTISKLNVIEAGSAGTRAKIADDFNTQDNKQLFLSGTAGKMVNNPGAFTGQELSGDIDRLGSMAGVSDTANFQGMKTAIMVEKSVSDILPNAIAQANAANEKGLPGADGTFASDNILIKALSDIKAANPNMGSEQGASLDTLIKEMKEGSRQGETAEQKMKGAEARASSASKLLDNLTKEGQVASTGMKGLASSSDRIMEEDLANSNKMAEAKVAKQSRQAEMKSTGRDMDREIKEMFGGRPMSVQDVQADQGARLKDRTGSGNIADVIRNVTNAKNEQDASKKALVEATGPTGSMDKFKAAVESGRASMEKLRNNTLALKDAQGFFKEQMAAAGKKLADIGAQREGGRSFLDKMGSDPAQVAKEMSALQRMKGGEQLTGEDFNNAKSGMESLSAMLPDGDAKAQMKADFYKQQTETNPVLKALVESSNKGTSNDAVANAAYLATTKEGQSTEEAKLRTTMEEASKDYQKVTTALEDLNPSLDALGAAIKGMTAEQWLQQKKSFETPKVAGIAGGLASGVAGGMLSGSQDPRMIASLDTETRPLFPTTGDTGLMNIAPEKLPSGMAETDKSAFYKSQVENNPALKSLVGSSNKGTSADPVANAAYLATTKKDDSDNVRTMNSDGTPTQAGASTVPPGFAEFMNAVTTLNTGFTGFNASVGVLTTGFAGFVTSVDKLAKYSETLAALKIPEKIEVTGTFKHEFVINGGGILTSLLNGPLGDGIKLMIDSKIAKHIDPLTGETKGLT